MQCHPFGRESLIQLQGQKKYTKGEERENSFKNLKYAGKQEKYQLSVIQDFMRKGLIPLSQCTVAAMKILILCSNEHKTIHTQPWQNL